MLQYYTYYLLYPFSFAWQLLLSYAQLTSTLANLLLNKKALLSLSIILSVNFSTVYAQEGNEKISAAQAEIMELSGLELYRKAKSIKRSNRLRSIELANAGLKKATFNNNHRLRAEIHTLLGKLAREAKEIDKSIEHFLNASLIYSEINDKRNQIMSSVEHAKTVISEKRYDEGEKIIDQLLPIAMQYGGDLPIALIKMTKGDGYYQQKRYKEAIAEYKQALKYLTDEDTEVQKRLAHTYQKIAQTYTRIKNREQAIVFYKHSLATYTILQNKRSIASSYKNLAMQERYQGNYVIGLDYAIRGIKIQRQIDDNKSLAKALTGAGIIYRYLGRYEKSLAHFQEAHQLYQNGNYISDVAETSKEIGLIYTRLREFDQARSFYQVAIDLPENKVGPRTRVAALREIAVIDLNAGNYEAAEKSALKAYHIYQTTGDKLKSSTTARILSRVYLAQHDMTQAIFYARKALAYATEKGSEKDQIKALTLLGRILIDENIDEAVVQLKKSLALSTKLKIKKEMLSTLHALRLAEKSRDNIAESLSYAEKEIDLANLIYKEREEKGLVQAKAKLDSHKMEMELESLREKTTLDQLELAKKNNEIEIAGQAGKISELELTKNRYANIALASLLIICLFVVLYIYRRFVDSRKQNKELDYLATRDPLTNCYNRRVLFDLMNRDFSDVELIGEYCIIMADIDHFKQVNDTYGHSAGDEVLQGVANILKNGVRKNDIAARFGGEEFCLVLPGAAQEQAMRVAEIMRQKVEASRFADIPVTCSFGVTSIRFDAKAPKDLIDQADLALYQSKKSGRNQVTLWDKHFKI